VPRASRRGLDRLDRRSSEPTAELAKPWRRVETR
jgi:hypothetical protein